MGSTLKASSEPHLLSPQNVALSIIMPACNLEDRIVDALTSASRVAESSTSNYEIIVVDDGSTDGTYLRAKSLKSDKIRVMRNTTNQGKGYSIKKGVELSIGDAVVMLDGDMEINPDLITSYLRALQSHDVIISSKRHPLALYEAPLMRKFLSLAFNVLVRILTGVRVSDTQTGLKAFNGRRLRDVIKLVLVKRYAFDVEVLIAANLLKLRVLELPAKIVQKGGFSVRSIFYMLIDLLGVAYRLRILRWYQQNIATLKPQYEPLIPL